jgi:predicted metal-dependent phosphoesterase TrpH
MTAFFEEYLVPGAKAFVPRRWPDAEQAVELIHDAGGAAVVAHPYWDVKDPDQVETLIGALDVEGVEAFYPDHSREQTKHLLRICSDRGLVPTGSSDFHGPTHKTFSRFGAYQTYGLGEPEVPPRPSASPRRPSAPRPGR